MLRSGQAKQRALEALTERLSTLEQQVTDFLPWLPSSHAGAGGAIPSGFNAASQQRIENPQQLGGKKKKEGDVPTEEDIRQKFLQGAAKPDAAHNFNLEAPVFVPRGAPPVADAAPANEDDVEVEEAEVGSEEADAVEEEPVAPATATPAVPVEPAVAEAVEDPSVAVASAPGLAEAVPAPDPVEPTPVSDAPVEDKVVEAPASEVVAPPVTAEEVVNVATTEEKLEAVEAPAADRPVPQLVE